MRFQRQDSTRDQLETVAQKAREQAFPELADWLDDWDNWQLPIDLDLLNIGILIAAEEGCQDADTAIRRRYEYLTRGY